MWYLPKIFLRLALVSPIRRSQKPSNHGAFLGMNFHTTPCALRDVDRVSDCRSLVISSAADVNIDALSDIMMWGHDFRLTKHLNAKRNVFMERSVTISRCITLVFAHVNRHIYTLSLFLRCCCGHGGHL